jgi:hypothetical protein
MRQLLLDAKEILGAILSTLYISTHLILTKLYVVDTIIISVS